MGRASNSKKKPKGKKARAKAKKERQWGEEIMEPTEMRRGKSRLLNEQFAPKEQKYATSTPMEDSDASASDSEASASSSDEDLENRAYTNLLTAIKGKTVSDEDGHSSDSTANDTESDEEMEEIEAIELPKMFDNRFCKDPFSEVETESLKVQSKLSKVPFEGLPNVQLHVTTNLLQKAGMGDVVSTKYCKGWMEAYRANVNRPGWLEISQQRSRTALFGTFLASYHDILWTLDSQTKQRASTQSLLCRHVTEHVWQLRSMISLHGREIKSLKEQEIEPTEEQESVWKDQGYCRPTVLVLLPTRGVCYSFLQELMDMLPLEREDKDESMQRFETEYGPVVSDDNAEPDDDHRKKAITRKGREWQELFGENANDDDDFKLGMAIYPRKPNGSKDRCDIKLYADFYKSDIILASPLGLKMTADEDSDFLTSIESCLVVRADVMLMQNWDHVTDVLGLLNGQPKNANDTDFSRVRQYTLQGQAPAWRQLVVTASFVDPIFLSTMRRFSRNFQGQVQVREATTPEASALSNVVLPIRQVFQRVPCQSLASHGSDRIEYFSDKILAQILRHDQGHTMIFIPSYFDFVSLRNLLLEKEVSFCSVTEYSRISEVSRGRARFLQGRKPIMLYTGRAHYFLRHQIKGVRHVIFLGLPEHASFYSDMINLINDGLAEDSSHDASSLVLYTKYDAHALERIAGAKNCRKMQGEKSSFVFSV